MGKRGYGTRQDRDPVIRARAATALGKMGRIGSSYAAQVALLLNDENMKVTEGCGFRRSSWSVSSPNLM